MDHLVMGVDSSTQSTTIELRSVESGSLVASAFASHPPTTPPRSEADPKSWWHALEVAASQLGNLRARVVGISVAGQQHGLVVLDEAGEVIRPAKLWNDTESATQAEALVHRIGADAWAEACGLVPLASFTISKLAWLVENEPENAVRVARVMLPHDWLTWRLTGNHVTDRGDASGTGWFDPRTSSYRPDLLSLVEGRDWAGCLPEVLGPSEPAGPLGEVPARQLGLSPGIVVGAGTGDNMAAALGLGLRPGDVTVSLGTSGTAFSVATSPSVDPSGKVAGFADASGRYLPLVCTLNATKVTDTVSGWLGVDHARLAELALAGRPGSDGLVLVPYFDGERTPNRPDATGLMQGITTGTTREAVARAAHEGVVCGLLHGVDTLSATGVDVSGRFLLTGGGARSPAYRRITADLAQRTVVVPTTVEVVAAGACLQAASVFTGAPPLDLAETWDMGEGTTVHPTPGIDAGDIRRAHVRASDLAV